MHKLPMRVRQSWVKIECLEGRFRGVVKICIFLENKTIFEQTNYIAILRAQYLTNLESLSKIDFLRFAASCLIDADNSLLKRLEDLLVQMPK